MNATATLTVSSIKMFLRNKQSLFFTLFMPLVIMTIFGFIGFDTVPKVRLGVVTQNPSAATEQFVNRFGDISALEVHKGNETDEREALKKGDRDLVVMIPDKLIPEMPAPDAAAAQAMQARLDEPTARQAQAARSGVSAGTAQAPTIEKQTITMLTNVAQQQMAQTGVSIISQMLDKATIAASGTPEIFELKTEEITTKNLKYIDFLLPGIVAMAIMQMALFSVAFLFVDYKEKGILKRLLATPMKPYQFVTANVIVRLIVALAQASILVAVGVAFFHVHIYGAFWLISLIAIFGSIMFLGLGFSISGLAKTVEAVPAIANLVAFPMLFLSGVFFPVDAMPEWLQHVVKYLPLTHFAHALREVMANGATASAIASDLYWMLGWSVGLIVLAVFSFRFEEKRM